MRVIGVDLARSTGRTGLGLAEDGHVQEDIHNLVHFIAGAAPTVAQEPRGDRR